jgi:hypothetical protein
MNHTTSLALFMMSTGTYVRLVHPYYLRLEGFQTDYFGSILHIEEHVREFDIQRRREDLVIDQLFRQPDSSK